MDSSIENKKNTGGYNECKKSFFQIQTFNNHYPAVFAGFFSPSRGS
jgi:hypothetical protein